MDGLVDVYMPDFKFWRRETARRLCKAKTYPEVAREVSPDTWVNVMGQYHPDHEVGQPARDGNARYPELDRRPGAEEVRGVRAAARAAGLWRLEEPGA